MLTVEEAVKKVKEFFQKMKGDWKIMNKDIIDWLNFMVVNAEEQEEKIIVVCEFNENIFSNKKVKYKVEIRKDNGYITRVERVE